MGEGQGGGRKGRASRPSLGCALVGSLAALLLSGCGLESVTYLSAPSFYWASGAVVLSDTGSAGSDIREFEILYRIYQDPSAALVALNSISSLSASSSYSPETIYNQLKGGSLNLRTALFAYTDPSLDDTTLKLAPLEQGIGSSFQISTTGSPWPVTKLVGTTSSGTVVAPAVDSVDTAIISGTPYIDNLSHLSSSSTDYTPASTSAAYPPSTAYLVLCVVAKSSSDFLNYSSYSLPTPLTSGGAVQPITLGQ
ncbi:MAG TPA: hypothetical protein VMV44_14550 [Rectinemataceae bacterium]|nr:hypothetical protein [Rectinemataceae bacterium]